MHGSLSSASGELLRDWAVAGLGISFEAGWDIEEDLAQGRLMRVLPSWDGPFIEFFATYLPGRPVARRVRAYGANPNYHYVGGHTTGRGTYVEPHYQTNPNGSTYDNYETRGNYNPHLGAYGTPRPTEL